jgi:hypothetical protein
VKVEGLLHTPDEGWISSGRPEVRRPAQDLFARFGSLRSAVDDLLDPSTSAVRASLTWAQMPMPRRRGPPYASSSRRRVR